MRRVQQGEWSTVNHYCYSTDYTARPSICLTPSLTLPPPSQGFTNNSLSRYLSVFLSRPAHPFSLSRWPINPFTHAASLGEMLMIVTSTPACRKALARGVKKEEKKMHWRIWQEGSKFYYSLGDWGIQQASLQPFIYSARQPLSHTRTFSCRNWPALTDLSPVAAVVLLLGGRGWLFADRMTWSHVKLLLVIGSFLFRRCVEGHMARQVSRAGLKAKCTRFGC